MMKNNSPKSVDRLACKHFHIFYSDTKCHSCASIQGIVFQILSKDTYQKSKTEADNVLDLVHTPHAAG